ncbi:MAG: hypothetical protein E6J87_17670 [Deltaproteobacteria bacterium]|nr:MAG: hypothetical protein E6J87_17670 [Deltaproteobacteria bacterium]
MSGGAQHQRLNVVGVLLEDAAADRDRFVVGALRDAGRGQRYAGLLEPVGRLDRLLEWPHSKADLPRSDQRTAVAVEHFGIVGAGVDQLLQWRERAAKVALLVLEHAHLLERIRRAASDREHEQYEQNREGDGSRARNESVPEPGHGGSLYARRSRVLESRAVNWVPTRRFWRGPWPWVIGAAMLALAVVAPLARKQNSEPLVDPRPIGTADDIAALSQRKDLNVLFVLIDTLRASRLRTYGYGRPTSPFFDLIASQGVRFDRHLSQSSWTKCSMASLWTGLYPQRVGVTRFEDVVPQQAKTAAEIFHDAGFRTAGIWRNGWVEGYFGFDQGFDVYTRPNPPNVPAEYLRANPTVTSRGNDLDVVDTAGEFLRIYGR